MMVGTTIFVTSALLSSLAHTPDTEDLVKWNVNRGYWMFAIGRLLAGLGVGIVCVVTPMYISEIVPEENRGYYG